MNMERRAYQRYPVQLDVKLKKLDGSLDEIDAITVNVSFGGLGITVREELQSGTKISIEWPNPKFYYNGVAVVIGAIVDIVKPERERGLFKIGVKFVDHDSELIQSLLNWIQMQTSIQNRAKAVAKRSSRQQPRMKF